MRIVIFTTQNHQQANFIIKNILEQNRKYFPIPNKKGAAKFIKLGKKF